MRGRIAIFGLVASLVAGTAQAQSQAVPTDSLSSICSGLLAESPGGVSGDHVKLCSCLVRETSAQLTIEEMSAYAQATLESKAPPDAVMRKVTAVATKCLQESQ